MRRFYVGVPTLEGLPLRIGEGFEAKDLQEARRKAYRTLSAHLRGYGYLCEVNARSVTTHGTVRMDGMYSLYIMVQGTLPAQEFDHPEVDWKWKRIPSLCKG